jgi:hypothetical protein
MIPFCNHLFHQSVIFARGHFEKPVILETCCLMKLLVDQMTTS